LLVRISPKNFVFKKLQQTSNFNQIEDNQELKVKAMKMFMTDVYY